MAWEELLRLQKIMVWITLSSVIHPWTERYIQNIMGNMLEKVVRLFFLVCGCGFWHVQTGAVGDSRYITYPQVLDEQKEFAEGDLSSLGSFFNIFDKG